MDRQKQDNFNLLIQYIKEGYLQISFKKTEWQHLQLFLYAKYWSTQGNYLKKGLYLLLFILCSFYSIVILTIILVITKGWHYLFTIVIYTLINGLILNKIGMFLISAQALIDIDFLEELLRIKGIVFSTTNSYRKTSSKIPFILIKTEYWELELLNAISNGLLPKLENKPS